MRVAKRLIAPVFGVLLFVTMTQLRGQDLAIPMVGGLAVHCTDASGATVYTRFLQQYSDWAASTIDPATGERIIMMNLSALSHEPGLVQLFVYAHECGHHMSGDVIAGQIFHEVNFNREETADRIGIRLLRDQLHITSDQANSLASVFQNNPPMFPFYLPGPQRAQWIRNCYATNNDDCSPTDKVAQQAAQQPVQRVQPKAANVPAQPPSDKAQIVTMHELSLKDALSALTDASLSNFVFVKYKDGLGLDAVTITIDYNGNNNIKGDYVMDDQSHLAFLAYILQSESDGLAAKNDLDAVLNQVSSVLNGWTRKNWDNTQLPSADELMGADFSTISGQMHQMVEVALCKVKSGGFTVELFVDAASK